MNRPLETGIYKMTGFDIFDVDAFRITVNGVNYMCSIDDFDGYRSYVDFLEDPIPCYNTFDAREVHIEDTWISDEQLTGMRTGYDGYKITDVATGNVIAQFGEYDEHDYYPMGVVTIFDVGFLK